MDQPFLIASSSGEVARFLNRVIHMEIIDETLSKAESYKRKTNKQIDDTELSIVEIQKYIDSYSWIEEAEPIVKQHTKVTEKIDVLYEEIDSLELSIKKHEEAVELMPNVADWNKADTLIQSISKICNQVDSLEREADEVEDSISRYRNLREQVSDIDFDKGLDILSKVSRIEESINTIAAESLGVSTDINRIQELQRLCDALEIDIKEMEEKIPDTCPLCGAEIDEETKHEIAHNE